MRTLSLLSGALMLVGCSSSWLPLSADSDEGALSVPVPLLDITAMSDSLTAYSQAISSDIAVDRKMSLFRNANDVAATLEMSWCGDIGSQRDWTVAFQDVCLRSDGEISGDFCYSEVTSLPLFQFIVKPDHSLAHCDSSLAVAPISVMLMEPYAVSSYEWLDFARSRGFMTADARKLRDYRMKELELLAASQERLADERKRAHNAQVFAANKRALEGRFNTLVCSADLSNKLLGYYYVGRVVATYDNALDVELIDYVGHGSVPDTVSSHAVINSSYIDWAPCDG